MFSYDQPSHIDSGANGKVRNAESGTPEYTSELVLIRRRRNSNFTQIPNDLIRNERVNWKPLGLLIYLLSLPPRNWRISLQGLCRIKHDGEASIRSALKQLESLGYVKIIRERSAAGRFIGARWLVSDQPIVDWGPYLQDPVVDIQPLVLPDVANQEHTNTGVIKIRKSLTTTTLTASGAVDSAGQSSQEMMLWLCERLLIEPEKARQESVGLDPETTLDVLSEVYECKTQGGIKTTVHQFFASLLQKARKGKFSLSAGVAIRKKLPELLSSQHKQFIGEKANALVPAPKFTVVPDEVTEQWLEKLAQSRNAMNDVGGKNGCR